MISRDRELLALLRKLNNDMGEIVLALMRELPGGVLAPDKLRELEALLQDIADALAARADEIDGVGEARPLVVEAAMAEPD